MPAAALAPGGASARTTAELSRIVVGSSMSLDALWNLIEDDRTGDGDRPATINVGSIGYERFRTNSEFAETLKCNGIELLIDVRELPISRKRGFAKTALAQALGTCDIEYMHARGLGNPKEFRDLYKAGDTARGRAGYASFLLSERLDTLRKIVPLLTSRRTALMCVEHDADTCHRDVIFSALRTELGLSLAVTQLPSDS